MTDFFRGNGDLRGYKGQFYEGGLRVPLIVRWPGHVAAGTTSDQLCGFQDILPTLAEIAGATPPSDIDGPSLVPTLTGVGTQPQHEGFYWEYPARGGITRAARMGHWKAIQARPAGPVELYNLDTDPHETKNVADENPDVVRRIVAWMDRAHIEPRDYPKLIGRKTIQDFVR
jgi:arylsulfatase A-like enzyme